MQNEKEMWRECLEHLLTLPTNSGTLSDAVKDGEVDAITDAGLAVSGEDIVLSHDCPLLMQHFDLTASRRGLWVMILRQAPAHIVVTETFMLTDRDPMKMRPPVEKERHRSLVNIVSLADYARSLEG